MPAGVDADGYYQVYSSGKADPFASYNTIWEVGYIKKGEYVAITDPADEGILHTSDQWAIHDFSGTVPAGANALVGRWAYSAGISQDFIVGFRPFGSKSEYIRQNNKTQVASQVAKLDSQQRCEYRLSLWTNDFYVLGYEIHADPVANKITLDTGTVDVG
jgi:hypothetical protein